MYVVMNEILLNKYDNRIYIYAYFLLINKYITYIRNIVTCNWLSQIFYYRVFG